MSLELLLSHRRRVTDDSNESMAGFFFASKGVIGVVDVIDVIGVFDVAYVIDPAVDTQSDRGWTALRLGSGCSPTAKVGE